MYFSICAICQKKNLFSSSLCKESNSNNLYNLWKCTWREGKYPREEVNDEGKERRIGRKKAGSVYCCLMNGIAVFMIITLFEDFFD